MFILHKSKQYNKNENRMYKILNIEWILVFLFKWEFFNLYDLINDKIKININLSY
jgi:hypothetical protein